MESFAFWDVVLKIFLPVILALFGGGGIVYKLLNRKVDEATVVTMVSDAESRAKESAANVLEKQVLVLTNIIQAVQKQLESKDVTLGKLEERVEGLIGKIQLLEERERHQLVRAAVHEAWDQMAFGILSQMDPNHPPPPPIGEIEHNEP